MKMPLTLNRSLLNLAIVLLSVILSGCPFQSKIALNKNDAITVDKNLLGRWTCKNIKEEDELIELTVEQLNDKEYIFTFQVTEPNKETERENWKGFTVEIKGQKIINVETKTNEPEYDFYRYKIKGNTLRVAYVSDNFIADNSFSTEKELRDFLEKNIKSRKLFEKEIILMRE